VCDSISLLTTSSKQASNHTATNRETAATMAGGVVVEGTADVGRVEAPVTMKAYLICAFAAFGGIFFGYDTG
jgi:hypothetical protein